MITVGFHMVPRKLYAEELPPLEFSVEYDTPIAGEPATFTLHASGAYGNPNNYRYYFQGVDRYNGSYYEYVTDPSRGAGYVTTNEFTYTFEASGDYRLTFYVMDLTKNSNGAVYGYVRQYVYITIEDASHPDVDTIAEQIAAACPQGDDYTRALWLHDYLISHVVYDTSYTYCSAEGALVYGKGTCEAYVEAYTLLLGKIGIPSGREIGNGHAWNAVYLDGAWYQVDVTWDDNGYSEGKEDNYYYFAIPDSTMQKIHSEHSVPGSYQCTSWKDNYLVRSGRADSYANEFVSRIQEKLNAKETKFTLSVSSSRPAAYKDVIYDAVAWKLSSYTWTANKASVTVQVTYDDDILSVTATYPKAESGSSVPSKENITSSSTDADSSSSGSTSGAKQSVSVSNSGQNAGSISADSKIDDSSSSTSTKSDPSAETPVSGSENSIQKTQETKTDNTSFPSAETGKEKDTGVNQEGKETETISASSANGNIEGKQNDISSVSEKTGEDGEKTEDSEKNDLQNKTSADDASGIEEIVGEKTDETPKQEAAEIPDTSSETDTEKKDGNQSVQNEIPGVGGAAVLICAGAAAGWVMRGNVHKASKEKGASVPGNNKRSENEEKRKGNPENRQ